MPYTPNVSEKTFDPSRTDEFLQRYEDTKRHAEAEPGKYIRCFPNGSLIRQKSSQPIHIVYDEAITEEIIEASNTIIMSRTTLLRASIRNISI